MNAMKAEGAKDLSGSEEEILKRPRQYTNPSSTHGLKDIPTDAVKARGLKASVESKVKMMEKKTDQERTDMLVFL